MKNNDSNRLHFDPDWSGWQPKTATDHQIESILKLTTPTDRLRWLVEMLEGLEKLGLILDKKNTIID